MSKLKTRIVEADYKKGLKRIIIAFIILVLAAGIGTGIRFGSRIPEIKNQIKAVKEANRDEISWREYKHDSENSEVGENKEGYEIDWRNILDLTTGDKIFIGCFAGLFGLLFVIYWLFVTAYAVSRSIRAGSNPYIFGVLTFITNLFGIMLMLVWFALHAVCQSCGKLQLDKAEFCSYCGTKMHRNCPECGEKLYPKDIYCPGCGKKYSEEKE